MPVRMPALSPTMTEGKLIEWYKAVGDEVSVGDVLFDMETDKATMAVEATEDGYLAKILVADGTEAVQINTLVAVMVEDEGEEPEDIVEDAPASPEEPAAKAPAAAPAVPQTPSPPATPPTPAGAATTRQLSPAVLRMLKEHKLDGGAIPASGPRGHLLKGDILAYMEGGVPAAAGSGSAAAGQQDAAPAPPAPGQSSRRRRRRGDDSYTDVPTTNMRKVIAARLTESKTTVPHAYASVDVDVTSLMSMRKEAIAAGVPKFSLNDLIIKAAGMSLRAVPEVNATLSADGGILPLGNVDVSVAVSTPGGLITPIVTGADFRSVGDIATTVADLAERARTSGLAPHEFQGGSFSVSNLGMFGVTSFSAVINPPQACILAVGTGKAGVANGNAATFMSFTLSCDARVVDDALAARWLSVFKSFLEQPQMVIPSAPVDQFE